MNGELDESMKLNARRSYSSSPSVSVIDSGGGESVEVGIQGDSEISEKERRIMHLSRSEPVLKNVSHEDVSLNDELAVHDEVVIDRDDTDVESEDVDEDLDFDSSRTGHILEDKNEEGLKTTGRLSSRGARFARTKGSKDLELDKDDPDDEDDEENASNRSFKRSQAKLDIISLENENVKRTNQDSKEQSVEEMLEFDSMTLGLISPRRKPADDSASSKSMDIQSNISAHSAPTAPTGAILTPKQNAKEKTTGNNNATVNLGSRLFSKSDKGLIGDEFEPMNDDDLRACSIEMPPASGSTQSVKRTNATKKITFELNVGRGHKQQQQSRMNSANSANDTPTISWFTQSPFPGTPGVSASDLNANIDSNSASRDDLSSGAGGTGKSGSTSSSSVIANAFGFSRPMWSKAQKSRETSRKSRNTQQSGSQSVEESPRNSSPGHMRSNSFKSESTTRGDADTASVYSTELESIHGTVSNSVSESVVAQKGVPNVGSKSTQMGYGWAKGKSFLECVVYLLKGFKTSRKMSMFKSIEVSVWLSEDLQVLRWRQLLDESVPSTSVTHEDCGMIRLNDVTRVKSQGVEVYVEFSNNGLNNNGSSGSSNGSAMAKGSGSVELNFENKESAKIYFTGLCCLLRPDAKVSTRTRNVIPDLVAYNVFFDLYNGKRVVDRKRIAEYILLTTLGRGSFGKVKLAISVKTKLFYAVKVIPKVVLRKQQRGVGGSSGASSDLVGDLREIAIMRKLKHPNVLKIEGVYDDEQNDRLYIVIEFMAKGVVMDSGKLQGATPLGLLRAREVFIDAMSALEYLHKSRVVHRDIKPDNLLSKADGTVKIADFGTAKLYSHDRDDEEASDILKTQKTTCGTPAFTSPELCLYDSAPDGPAETYPADIWSLGISLYYMVYGQVPFVATNVFKMYKSVCEDELKFPAEIKVPKEFIQLLKMLLERDPYKRATFDQIWNHSWIKEGVKLMQEIDPNRAKRPGKTSDFHLTAEDATPSNFSVKTALRQSSKDFATVKNLERNEV
mmetsp:Transcript_11284/g.20391  ORF Transcript_11284/g.20391 Transcript_11284/m.20391 type:complete len:1017 (-) Transcript_11284:2131-5181(-)